MSNRVNFNKSGSLFPSGAQAIGTTYSADQQNLNRRGVVATVAVSVDNTGGTLTVTIQGKDPASGTYYDILTSAGLNVAAGLISLRVYPGIAAVTNRSVSDILPATWRLKFVVASAAITATVGACEVV